MSTNVLVTKISPVKISTNENHSSLVIKDNLSPNKNKIQVSEKVNDVKSVTVAKKTAIQVTAQGITPGGSGVVLEPNLDGGSF
jgi:hypothetical protein